MPIKCIHVMVWYAFIYSLCAVAYSATQEISLLQTEANLVLTQHTCTISEDQLQDDATK